MDVNTLEEEYDALLSDKAGVTEYLKSLQDQIEKLKVTVYQVSPWCLKITESNNHVII